MSRIIDTELLWNKQVDTLFVFDITRVKWHYFQEVREHTISVL